MELELTDNQKSIQPQISQQDSTLSRSSKLKRRQSIQTYAQQNRQLQSRIVKTDGESEKLNYVKYPLKYPVTILSIKFTEAFWSPIYCSHPLARYIEIISSCLSVLTVIIIPYFSAFEDPYSKQSLAVFQGFASCIFCLEVLLKIFHIVPADLIAMFLEGKIRPSLFQTRMLILRHWVFKKYWWLIFFSISALPWGLIAENYNDAGERYGLSCLNGLRLYFIYRTLDHAVHNIGINYYVVRLTQYILTIFIAANFFACTYYVLAINATDFNDTWLYVAEQSKPAPPSPLTSSQYYMLSLYWSFTTSSTVGYGDICPQNTNEYALVTIYQVFNIFMMAWLVGNVTTLVTQGHERMRLYREEFLKMEQFMKKFELPSGLRNEMAAHMVLKFDLEKEYRSDH